MPCFILHHPGLPKLRTQFGEFDTWDGHHCRTPWCCKLHASHRSRRKHPQRYNEPNSLVTSATSCTNLLHTRTIQCKECVLRTPRPRLLRLTSKHHCRIDMQTEQWSSLWTYQFPHRLPHQNEPSSARPSTDTLASICTLNLWQFHGRAVKVHTQSFYTQTLLHMVLLHKHTLTHRRFDTQKPLHTNAFTHRRFYTQTLFTHESFYTQTGFTHRRFYTQTLLHADSFYTRTHAFTHKRFYTQTRWHTNAFTHRRFYTQMLFTHAHTLSHTNAFTHRRFYTHNVPRIFASVFDVQRPFRA